MRRLLPAVSLLLGAQVPVIVSALLGRGLGSSIALALFMDACGMVAIAFVLRADAAGATQKIVPERSPSGAPAAVEVGAGGSIPAQIAGASTQPVDESLIGTETSAHHFIPDYRAQSMPGFAAIYQQITAGEMIGFVMVVAGPDRGRGVPIKKERITVGRNAELSLVIHDTSVSARQCDIWAEGAQVFVGDAGSKNGTWLNNKPVTQKQELASCDVIAFGATKMLVTLGA